MQDYYYLLLFIFYISLLPLISITGIVINSTEVPGCHSFNCGNNFTVAYPFWISVDAETSTPSFCGYSDLKLQCINNTPVIQLAGEEFAVTSIDNQDKTVNLKLNDVALYPNETCPKNLRNITLAAHLLLQYTPSDANLTVFLNCTGGPQRGSIKCLNSGGSTSYAYIEHAIPMEHNWSDICADVVKIPVLQQSLVPAMNVSEFYGEIVQKGFELSWAKVKGGEMCSPCENSGGRCGFSEANNFVCYCVDGPQSQHCHVEAKRSVLGIIIGVVTGLAGGFLAICVLVVLIRRNQGKPCNLMCFRTKESNTLAIEDFLKTYESFTPRRYRYSDVKKMTKSFTDKLGNGGYGSVYKGELLDGRQVAVKVLSNSKGNGEDFINEVSIIGRTSHVNIVTLIGFCMEGSNRALIYGFMPNGSLEKHVYNKKTSTRLGCTTLYDIAIGVARGLEYLHRGSNTRIVHFDIKPHNILLDEDFCPKISDFGLAKLSSHKDSFLSMTNARGTIGYIAPEVFSRSFGNVSSKSDVYSYGMMLLEMVGGRRNAETAVENSSEAYFPHWIYEHFDEDGALENWGLTNETKEIARKMIIVGLWCVQTMPANRPSISRVVEMLSGSISDLVMPPKPCISSPAHSTIEALIYS